MKQLDKNTLFLSAVIVLSCSVLLFHMDPIQIVDREIWLWLNSLIHVLFLKPAASLIFLVGLYLLSKMRPMWRFCSQKSAV
ncbi:TPA: hypothetical protein TZW69_001498 [Streptococcus suis]|uniref:hypothetical protein n=2 Tax=Streptococcus suis TaxID=1307 RepID=UPI0005B9869E|nr:hypothetical protein [Streptococcus suis]MCQ8270777.1 hypothetical protein [Streptococcus suis]MDW8720087.1 hypothetical protein [Streptococcus suis]MDY7593175.1 hypothetical protein [Streptococcus suis]MDY7601534.1 hypothetical protein [Streptococcus suis]NQH42321.1 hypothetical protein [Streptococcus suis]